MKLTLLLISLLSISLSFYQPIQDKKVEYTCQVQTTGLNNCMEHLPVDITHLVVNATNMNYDYNMSIFNQTLPNYPYLKSIDLRFSHNKIVSSSTTDLAEAFETLLDLDTLKIDLSNNDLTNIDFTSNFVDKNLKLKTLLLNFQSNDISSIDAFKTTLLNQVFISDLSIILGINEQLTDYTGLQYLTYSKVNIKKLTISIVNNGQVNMNYITPTINNVIFLDTLVLDLHSSELVDFSIHLAPAYEGYLQNLDIHMNVNLESLIGWAAFNKNIVNQKFSFERTDENAYVVRDVSALGLTLKNIPTGGSISYNFNNNQISDVSTIKDSLQDIKNLQNIEFNFENNQLTQFQVQLNQSFNYKNISFKVGGNKNIDLSTMNDIFTGITSQQFNLGLSNLAISDPKVIANILLPLEQTQYSELGLDVSSNNLQSIGFIKFSQQNQGFNIDFSNNKVTEIPYTNTKYLINSYIINAQNNNINNIPDIDYKGGLKFSINLIGNPVNTYTPLNKLMATAYNCPDFSVNIEHCQIENADNFQIGQSMNARYFFGDQFCQIMDCRKGNYDTYKEICLQN